MKQKDLNKDKHKPYNLTDLNPQDAFERHVFHRDQFAHFFRWSHVFKEAKEGEKVADFGCGQGSLLELLYRNRTKCKSYIGMDIRTKTIAAASEKWKHLDWATFYAVDLTRCDLNLSKIQADKVVSFEVMEHVHKSNGEQFLLNFLACGKLGATYMLSTPNYDQSVGAAQNHIYGGGIQEWDHFELQALLEKYFLIERKYGTFASIRDYRHLLEGWQKEMFEALKGYYDVNLLANMMAPFFPEQSRNTLWVMRAK